jgi:hypothetical protein
MKWIFFSALLLASIFIPYAAQAGTLENRDLTDYRYETFGPIGVRLSHGIIYSQSFHYGFCNEGCELRLLKTKQTITVEADDHVVINNGVMEYKQENK